MTEEQTTDQPQTPPDAAQITEQQPDKDQGQAAHDPVPYDRFKEVNDARKAEADARQKLEAELAQFKAEKEQAAEDEAKKRGEFEQLYGDAKAKLDTTQSELKTLQAELDAYREADKARLEKTLERASDAWKIAVSKMDTRDALLFLDEHSDEIFAKPTAPETDAGTRGDTGKRGFTRQDLPRRSY